MAYLPCILLFHLLIFLSPLSGETLNNLTLPHQHPNPEAVVHEVQRRILTSVANVESKDQQSCQTGNPIDDCWRCDPNWPNNRQQLADCAIGFGQGATGGKGGQIYVVADPSDNDVANPTPGTLRHAVIQTEPLWIVFSADMDIKLKHELVFNSFKTIDGRGANVGITGGGCITIQDVNNIIIHNIRIYDCVPTEGASIRMTPALVEKKGRSDGDGITVRNSRNIWVDHCTLSHCTDGLLDCTEGSTAITISNNLFTHHEKVMLLGHTDDYEPDKGMQVTVAFNHFGEELVERMPRCRNGYFHVVNNDYTQWKLYAIGGSANPTIYSQGNRFVASNDPDAKEVTKRMDADEGDWREWNWISEGDLMVNGAVFTPSGQGVITQFTRDSDAVPKPAAMIDQLTSNSGVLVGAPGDNGRPSGGSDNSGPPNGINTGVPPGGIINGCPPGGIDNGSGMNGRNGGSSGGGTVYWNKAPPPTTTSRISFYLLVIFLYITSSYGARLML